MKSHKFKFIPILLSLLLLSGCKNGILRIFDHEESNSSLGIQTYATTLITNEDTSFIFPIPGIAENNYRYRAQTKVAPTKGRVLTVPPPFGRLEYIPNPDANGVDTFSFDLIGDSGIAATSTVRIEIRSVNDAPLSEDASFEARVGDTFRSNFVGSDIDGDDFTYQITSSSGVLEDASTGAYRVTSNVGATVYIKYKVIDSHGLESEEATVSVNFLSSGNVSPVAVSEEVSTNEDTARSITLHATDADDGSSLSYRITSNPTKGSVTRNGNIVTYTPSSNANGTDYFSFRANDGEVDSNEGVITIEILPINDAPVSHPASYTGSAASTVFGTLNADDPDNDALIYYILSGNAVVNKKTGKFSIDTGGVAGTESFSFYVYDGQVTSPAVTVNVQVSGRTLGIGDRNLSFGTNGRIIYPYLNGNGNDTIEASYVQPDGKILVVGESYSDEWRDTHRYVARFNANGFLDTDFGTWGITKVSHLKEMTRVAGIKLLSSGQILVVGEAFGGLRQIGIFMARLNADGTADLSFAPDGYKVLVPDDEDMDWEVEDAAFQNDGKVVITGTQTKVFWSAEWDNIELLVARLNPDGSFDSTFSDDGIFSRPYAEEATGYSVAILTNDRIAVVGIAENWSGTAQPDRGVAVLLNANGTLRYDTLRDYGSDLTHFNKVIPIENGHYIAVGYTEVPSGTTKVARGLIARFKEDGHPVTTFGTGGYITSPLTSEFMDGLALAGTSRIVLKSHEDQRIFVELNYATGAIQQRGQSHNIADGKAVDVKMLQTLDGDILTTGHVFFGTGYNIETQLLFTKYNY